MNFAQAPAQGTWTKFVLFTEVGAVTNTGISQFTGNIGSNSGSATGFGNVNGQMHSGDGTTSTAAADVNILYNELKNDVPTFSHAPLLGNGDTLVAGVYAVSGNTTVSGKLYLDAKGDASKVFIFQVSAPLTTTTSSQIILINGTQACNVYWKVEGLISIGTNSSVKGTFLANNAAVTIASGAELEGRALSTSGAISVNHVKGYTPVGCGSPLLTGPAAPTLGNAACFALFSANGAVTNSGTTRVKGDVGTNVGLTTGFNPLLVQGMIHPIPDGSTSAAAASLLNAYNYLNTLPVDIELLYPAQFGNSLVLTPHTYLLNAGTTFTDTLFLNAQGNPDAVFVIKINGALSTSTHSQVVLMNGTQAKNVYWKVDGAAGIHDFSYFVGTLIVNNAAIDLTTGVTLIGRALTTNGAFSTSSIEAIINGGCSTLPVQWISFQGKAVNQAVQLDWSTSEELNNSLFTIEKSLDGNSFHTLTTVKAKGELGKITYNYSAIDPNPAPVTYYKISQTDLNGQTSYYNTIKVKSNVTQNQKVIQYVDGSFIHVQTMGVTPGTGSIELYSMDGKKISTQKINLTSESNNYRLVAPAQKGIYLLRVESNGSMLYNGKVSVK